MRRLPAAIVLIALLAIAALVLTRGGLGPSPTVSPPPLDLLAHYSDGPTFDYPAAWTAQHWANVSSFFSADVYLSPLKLPDPCTLTAAGGRCGIWPQVTLPEDGVVATWFHWGFPDRGIDPTFGQPSTVGGRTARIRIGDADQACAAIGGDHGFDVQVASDVQDNWDEFHACYRGPDTAPIEAAIRSMLATVAWSN